LPWSLGSTWVELCHAFTADSLQPTSDFTSFLSRSSSPFGLRIPTYILGDHSYGFVMAAWVLSITTPSRISFSMVDSTSMAVIASGHFHGLRPSPCLGSSIQRHCHGAQSWLWPGSPPVLFCSGLLTGFHHCHHFPEIFVHASSQWVASSKSPKYTSFLYEC
ncbi:hypothetical protein M9458_042521, partial [Cirrhinus mrigala]